MEKAIFKGLGIIAFLVVMLGFVCPFLVSAEDEILPILGILGVILTLWLSIKAAIKVVKSLSN